jgi:hypothetical protein
MDEKFSYVVIQKRPKPNAKPNSNIKTSQKTGKSLREQQQQQQSMQPQGPHPWGRWTETAPVSVFPSDNKEDNSLDEPENDPTPLAILERFLDCPTEHIPQLIDDLVYDVRTFFKKTQVAFAG